MNDSIGVFFELEDGIVLQDHLHLLEFLHDL